MKYYCVKQHDSSDCGPASLATIMKQYGLSSSIAKIRQLAGTDMQGTNVFGMIRGAERLGFDVKGVKGDQKKIFSGILLPCIAHVVKEGNMMHYVVIHKITKKKIIIADPACGIVKLTPEEFFGEVYINGGLPKYKWTGILIMLKPKAEIKKEDSTGKKSVNILSILFAQKTLLKYIFLASFMYTVLGIIGAFYFKLLVDDILPGALSETLTAVSIGIIVLSIFKILLDCIRSHLLLFLGQKVDIALLGNYYEHVLELPADFFSTRTVGEIISRFNDASHIRDTISNATMTLMLDTFMAGIGGVVLCCQSSMLFLITLFMVFLYIIIAVGFNRWYSRLNRKQMENSSELTSYLVESITGIQTIKIHNAERKAHMNTEIKFVKMLKSMFVLFSIKNVQSALKNFVEVIGEVIILWVGGVNVINGNMSIGQLITFNSLLVYFLDPIKNILNLQSQIQTAKVAIDRLGEVLSLEIEKSEKEYKKISPVSILGDIELKHVKFRYGSRRLVLDDINLKILKGQKIAFVGESGSGKTTLAKLLLHLYEVESGEILINGVNIDDIQIEAIRDKIAYIQQETFLFTGSIYDNIVLGMENATMDDVIIAAKMAQAHDFINEFPHRYETMLGENGVGLSGGQKQRIAIARAFIRKPEILILDEATSNLDSITESLLDLALNSYCSKITTIFIAHRLSTIKNCDLICVMENGKIIESGKHEQLLLKNGKYAQFVRQQSLESGN